MKLVELGYMLNRGHGNRQARHYHRVRNIRILLDILLVELVGRMLELLLVLYNFRLL